MPRKKLEGTRRAKVYRDLVTSIAPAFLARYRDGRSKGMGADSALRYAKVRAAPGLDWRPGRGMGRAYQVTEWEADGFRVVAKQVEDDTGGDYSYLGEFSNTWKPGAIEHSKGGREYRYFIPGISEAEHYKGLRDLYYGRAEARRLARSYVQQDYARAKDLGNGWCFVGVVVAAYREGVDLGSASLWGIESDSGDYFDEVARDLASEAIAEAHRALGKLCGGE